MENNFIQSLILLMLLQALLCGSILGSDEMAKTILNLSLCMSHSEAAITEKWEISGHIL